MRLVAVVCITCGWYMKGYDPRVVTRAGEVHAEILKPGHVVKSASAEGWLY